MMNRTPSRQPPVRVASSAAALLTVPRRLPFTLALAATMIAAAAATGTYRESLTDAHLQTYGHAPQRLIDFQWGRIATSAVLTMGGRAFYGSLLAAAASVGAVEWRLGSAAAASTFVGVHVATLAGEYFLVVTPLQLAGLPLGNLLLVAHDVGPSAGYFGCLGLLAASFPKRAKLLVLGVGSLLIARLAFTVATTDQLPGVLPADVAHAIAFPLGVAIGQWFYVRDSAP